MQNEDDLRGLAKVMEFMRAISILFVVVNIYWFCYQSVREWGIDIGVVDRILLGFQRTAGLFSNIHWTKLFAVLFLVLSCLGTKGVKEQKITWRKIILAACPVCYSFSATGGCSPFLYRFRQTPCCISPPLPLGISACSWRGCGCHAC